ncbi:heparan-alpha-glucosaminide N-acetyltransferase domain-containing protein [Methylomicrobium sp. Wu6]|uniref:DUF1624 domain-containing protein n=1 Tax=Methylomicrobium sp. Wu6 TaxID=3107928 RepID=UPI002DD64A71|nr:heparan-alpha-glucosaminide N-acetyltransferase domain-containing protein [Methylomicrobium sp. Wu6]MEC4748882.1 heparan-alpha-glucosaminide N-acetyltransferase domain-containing protein [Methylomicrobium sp. Wu6]
MNPTMHRLESIDMMRGFVMVLMALDHTRDYFTNAQFDPVDLSRTSAAYFLTRWITHLCAPTFMLLAGAGAFLSTHRKNLTQGQLSVYLASRGLWLIVLELTLVRFGWTFNWDYSYAIGQVIWALGWSMLGLAILVLLPRWVVAWFAMLLIAGHNAFDGIHADNSQVSGWLWIFLHEPGMIEYLPGHSLNLYYPLIPWIGVMAAGYCLGPVFLEPNRQTIVFWLGLFCLALFLLLRLGNLYGDPQPWAPQKNGLFTLFSMLNFQKYPPSLLYLLTTLGLMFIGLALLEGLKLQCIRLPLLTVGKAPLFFYLLHIYLIHGAALAVTHFRGLPVAWLFAGSAAHPFPAAPAPEYGYDLPVVYGVWLAVIVLLYPLCHAFVRIKQRYRHIAWLSYL